MERVAARVNGGESGYDDGEGHHFLDELMNNEAVKQWNNARHFSWRRACIALAITIGVLLVGYVALFFVPVVQHEPVWGVQYSKIHAEWIGIDWKQAYAALLDDVGVRRVRLGAYWPEIEPAEGVREFAHLDWLMNEAAARGAAVVLAVGRRLPRWPECHVPDWARALPEKTQRERIVALMRDVVERYRSHPALAMWQVENEPFLTLFGECPAMDDAQFIRERDLVRSLDPSHPILITDSGELSTWMRTAPAGDFLGTTMYRVVWNRLVGYWSYDLVIPPAFYRLKAWLAGKPADRMIVAELQAEPWIPSGDVFSTSLDEQRRSMDATRLGRHAAFARATGFREVYLWGAEYWYWLKTARNDASMWEAAQEILRKR
ncbi:beta-galactosidase [Candidatus Uhrbacteria bacterium]|nr:beta-galactosidase [Candidatus Uhrbacteria bacterium]